MLDGFEINELKNCPDNFAYNCKNYLIKCHECKGNLTSKYLQYRPINNTIINHPASIVQKSTNSFSKKGRVKEQKIIKESILLNSTRASGIINGDGDAYIYLSNIGKIKTEIKTRWTDPLNIKPTLKEFKEGISQDIKIFLIHNVKKLETYYYIDYSLFVKVWAMIIGYHYKLNVCSVNRNPLNTRENYIECWVKKRGRLDFWIEPDHKVFKKNFPCRDTLFLYKTKVGYYIATNETTFNELIELYQHIIEYINNNER